MNPHTLRNRLPSFIGLVLCVPLMGCSTFPYWPNNNMCCQHGPGPYHNEPHPMAAPLSPPAILSSQDTIGAEAVRDIAQIQAQLKVFSEDYQTTRDQLTAMDKTAETQRRRREDLLEIMQEIKTQLGSVQRDLENQRSDIAAVESSLRRQRSVNDRILASVESELSRALSEYDAP